MRFLPAGVFGLAALSATIYAIFVTPFVPGFVPFMLLGSLLLWILFLLLLARALRPR
jgi:hypothetical protein